MRNYAFGLALLAGLNGCSKNKPETSAIKNYYQLQKSVDNEALGRRNVGISYIVSPEKKLVVAQRQAASILPNADLGSIICQRALLMEKNRGEYYFAVPEWNFTFIKGTEVLSLTVDENLEPIVDKGYSEGIPSKLGTFKVSLEEAAKLALAYGAVNTEGVFWLIYNKDLGRPVWNLPYRINSDPFRVDASSGKVLNHNIPRPSDLTIGNRHMRNEIFDVRLERCTRSSFEYTIKNISSDILRYDALHGYMFKDIAQSVHQVNYRPHPFEITTVHLNNGEDFVPQLEKAASGGVKAYPYIIVGPGDEIVFKMSSGANSPVIKNKIVINYDLGKSAVFTDYLGK